MNKILLIIQREYIQRVKKRSFLIATLLMPILFPSIIGGVIYLGIKDEASMGKRVIEVYDKTNTLKLTNNDKFDFTTVTGDSTTVIESFKASEHYGMLSYDNPEKGLFTLFSKSSLSLAEKSNMENNIRDRLRELNIERLSVSQETIDALRPSVTLNTFDVVAEKSSSSGLSFAIGYFSGFLIYMFIFIYGAQVMNGVLEEKTNKIVEVILASVKPFQLMMGKVIGIASVGLTQFVLWIILIFAVSSVIFGFLGIDPASMNQNAPSQSEGVAIVGMLQSIEFLPLIFTFLFYFIGGYFLYGALFAAVGSAVDSQAEAQQFTLPVTLPLIASIMGLSIVLQNPDGNMAFWLSIIPFTSPVAMMGRMGFGMPPLWQMALSMVLLVGGFFFTSWVAGRIYRIGILTHGAKVNYKVLFKWFTQNN